MNALRGENKRRQQTLEDVRITREVVRQSEVKREQAPQSRANVCRRRRQMQSGKNRSY